MSMPAPSIGEPPITDAPIVIPSAWTLHWTSIGTEDGNVPGPCLIVLREDPATGGITYLTHLPPNWHDDALDVHPSTEEGFVIAGDVVLNDRHLGPGCYLFRPPGILHGPVHAPNDLGCTIFQRTSAPLRILRYDGDRFPHKDLQPVTDDYLTSDVAWSERTDTGAIPWTAVETGAWAGARLRWIHRNTRTGGGFVMLDLPPGWRGPGSPARGPIEEFVLKGAIAADGEAFGKWGYAYRPAGMPAGSYATDGGACLLSYWNGANEL